MTFLAINFLSISINLLLVIFALIVCPLMTMVILMQRPKQEGLGAAFGAGVTDQVFGARTTNVLQRGTVYLGSAFFILSLVLSILIGQQNKPKTLINKEKAAAAKVAPAAPAIPPVAPKSLAEELPEPPPAPVTPAAPPVEVPTPAPAPVVPAPPVTPTPGVGFRTRTEWFDTKTGGAVTL